MAFTQKITRHLRWSANNVLFGAGLRKTGRILSRPGNRILVYHGVDLHGQKHLNSRFIAASVFEQQIRYLSDHVQIVSLDDYFAGNFSEKEFTVAITFDDGYQNNLRYALPVLEQYKVPATFFLTGTGADGAPWLWMDFLDVATHLAPDRVVINGRTFFKKKYRHTRYFADEEGRKLVDLARTSPWLFIQAVETAFKEAGAWKEAATLADYWQLLSPPEIQQLSASPFAGIGAHGYSHQDLALRTPADVRLELRNCKAVLEKVTGKPVHSLAYPFGAYTRELVSIAEKAGFTQQFAVKFLFPEDHTDGRLRERLCINPFVSPANQWLAVRNGKY